MIYILRIRNLNETDVDQVLATNKGWAWPGNGLLTSATPPQNGASAAMSTTSLRNWLRAFRPAPLTAAPRDLWLGSLGAGLGLLLTEWISHQALGSANPWFIAPMGASAVLLFAVPASPLAQPWSIVGGNLIAALVGVTCVHFLGSSGPVAALAGAIAIALMFALRCLHPPGGAVALTAVLGGPSVHALGFGFVLWPVAVDSVLMLLLALVFNNLAGRRYPHHGAPRPHPHDTRDRLPTQRAGPTREDIDAALASFGEVLDIDRDDLEDLVMRTQLATRQRQGKRCAAATSCRAT
jgi:CBS domain-containing membrane protein